MEIWKNINGYENYQASNLGRVKTLNYNRKGYEKVLALSFVRGGYLKVALCNKGKIKQFRVGRLIGSVFIDNPENKPEINHINGIKTDDSVVNLEWVTKSENELHKYRILGHKGPNAGKTGKLSPCSKQIDQYTKSGEYLKTWDSMSDANRLLKISTCDISRVCKGKRKTCGGFIWKYNKPTYVKKNI